METPEGTRYHRNRYHLRKTAKPAPTLVPVEEIEVTPEDEESDEHEQEAATSSSTPYVPADVKESTAPTVEPQASKPAQPQRQRKPLAYY